MQHHCAMCGDPFVKEANNQKTCSEECAKEWERLRKERNYYRERARKDTAEYNAAVDSADLTDGIYPALDAFSFGVNDYGVRPGDSVFNPVI